MCGHTRGEVAQPIKYAAAFTARIRIARVSPVAEVVA